MKYADVLIIGSGIAALQLATYLSRDMNVIVLTKSSIGEGNSPYAQGGIAASLAPEDSPFLHYTDTLEAGRFINRTDAVLKLTKEAPEIIRDLVDRGCDFDVDQNDNLLLGMEGSHSHKRIVHGGGDQTGKAIVDCLRQHVGDHINIKEDTLAYSLLLDQDGACCGAKGRGSDGTTHTFLASHTVLATGGCGQLYSFTSNAASATGDGLALAYQAGAKLTDMEFVQFHPTLLYKDEETKGLVSEAVRGEGGLLINESGEKIMENVHPLKDLAPRHIVAQTIYKQIENGHNVYVDISGIPQFSERFPAVTSLCDKHGIQIEDGKIPVAPGCHFLMGGICTDEVGATSVEGLYAIGEVACTGVHGANRLASNSLLEGLVYGKRLAFHLSNTPLSPIRKPVIKTPQPVLPVDLPSIADIQQRMMRGAGIVRTKETLLDLLQWLEEFRFEVHLEHTVDSCNKEQITRLFMLTTAWLITTAALQREESRGGHYRSDFPFEKKAWESIHIDHHMQIRKGDPDEYSKATAIT
ncbi:L-aspartate oxidase [Pontibacillus chungwhensis BH030062]|uniref:L-aspartate oxidase n=1 Tax=Pontibacillus chungwhensis BH030062 TaxID=1385513 RepID=A0A0A2UWA5_9BACI|nr:L-aspartate oxidase [Pontibacillus chungwhensis]KGP92582.1 L-aspartate oxidase [Pontibacillus chungwhensis BH030062]